MAAIGGAYTYHRSSALHSFARVLSVAAAVVPLVFLNRPGIKPLIFPSLQATRAQAALESGAPTRTPVVLVIIDETSVVSLIDGEGKIDPVLYPNMARLAREGIWFRNATTVADFTRWAVPAILTGKYPEPELLPNADHHPNNLFTLLGPTHRMEVLESLTRLCPRDICPPPAEPLETRLDALARDLSVIYLHIVSPTDLRAHLPSVTEDWAGFLASQTTRRRRERRASAAPSDNYQIALTFAEWISKDDQQPTFYFLHTLLPHSPWQWLPSGQRNATRTPVPADREWSWGDDEWAVTQDDQRHLLQIGLVDTVLGRIIGRLEAAGLYDRATIVVTADHGVAFLPGTHRRNFSEQSAADIMRVPLLVKAPSTISPPTPDIIVGGQRISDRNVETIDIAPTIAKAVGLALPWKADGQSLLDATVPPPASKKILLRLRSAGSGVRA